MMSADSLPSHSESLAGKFLSASFFYCEKSGILFMSQKNLSTKGEIHMTNFIESIKEGFSVIKEELEELDRRTDFNRLFLDKMLNKMNLMDDNADILEYLDVDDSDDYYDDDREEHFGIVSLALMFIALAAITAIPCLADLI